MFIKGTAFRALRDLMIQELGEEKWNTFFEEYSKENSDFSSPIYPITDIDVLEFIKLNDAIIDRFYKGDKKTYFRFGEKSAKWVLREGPYQKLRIAKDYRAFIERAGVVYGLYYSESKAEAKYSEDVLDYWIRGVPNPYRNVYVEYTTIGFFRGGVQLTGCQVLDTQCIKGFSKGDDEVHYRLPCKT